MKDYQREICEALQTDIKTLSGQEWEIDTVYNFWIDWSKYMSAGFLGYAQGDYQQLITVVESMYLRYEKEDEIT